MGGGHVIFALGRSGGFRGGRDGNITTAPSNGLDLALKRLDLLLDGDDGPELACR